MCYCSFAIGFFLILKNQSEKHTPFCELYNAFNGISHKKLFAVFLPNRWEFLSDYLATYSGQKSQQIAGKYPNAI